ncbi:ABC1 family-like protein [Fragilaria crotonensis]|nr:ABC1 family-like protein [Fragilaria crotonensis]
MIKTMKALYVFILMVASHSVTLAFTSNSWCLRRSNVNRSWGPETSLLLQDVHRSASCRSASYSELFVFGTQTRVCTPKRLESSLKKRRRALSFAALLLVIPRRAVAAVSIASRSKKLIRPALLLLIAFMSLSSLVSTMQTRKRQAMDATSEWGRYAKYPAARGRAVMVIFLRLLPFWVRQRFANEERKTILKTKSGTIFADSLLRLGPLYIKLGQILSCRENLLPTEWITAMERLQDKVPAKSGRDALDLAHSAFGSAERFEELFSDFDSVPLAAASLGQVHRATLRGADNEIVAIKLQRPHLREIYDQDLALLTQIARAVDKIGGKRGKVGGVSQSWTQIFEDAKTILYREIDYRDEAENCVRFNADFGLGKGGVEVPAAAKSLDQKPLPSAAPWLRAPYVFQNISSEQALIMEYVPSIKITNKAKLDAANVTMEGREYLADSLARAYLRSFCVNRFFSTDPHPGNLGVEILDNGMPRLVMYDFGQACELNGDQAEGILDVIEAIIDYDSDRCVEAFAKMGVLKDGADLHMVRAKVQDNFNTGKVSVKQKKLRKSGYKFKETTPTDPANNATNDTVNVKDSEVMEFFQLPAEYAFVARALSQMDGVGKTLDADFDFISSSAPYLVEIKGVGNYFRDEWGKWVMKVEKQILEWQKPFL